MSELGNPPSHAMPDGVAAVAAEVITQQSAGPVPPVAPAPLTAVQLALYAGWTMAVLYGNLQDQPDDVLELRTVNQLQPPQRRELELARIGHLLDELSCVPAIRPSDLTAKVPADGADAHVLSPNLADLHLAILEALAASPPDVLLAYQLGRSLRDTVNPPLVPAADPKQQPVPALARQFGRERIATLQQWLATLADQLPRHAASVVATCLGRWSEFAAVTVGTNSQITRHNRASIEKTMCQYLLPQGDTWLMLLTGARPMSGLLSPEAYVAAAEEALHRSVVTARQVLKHYWFAVIIIAAAVGGLLYLTISNLGGAAEVWTSIATVGGGVGVSANAVGSATRRLAAEAGGPVFAMAEEDAMAWAVTTIPKVDLSRRGVRKLRKAGIAPPASLGRI
jgi:hypothetical protein